MTGRRSGCHWDTGDRIRGTRDIESWFCTTGLPVQVAIAGCIALSALPAIAQEVELEEIFVTGSRIARPDFESASPVVTIPEDRFQQTASATVETTLNSMPQLIGSSGGTTNNGGGDGQAYADLRGLGAVATLVLVDGRRLVPANGYGVPDLNLIPPSLVERVEVLTGGASAVYGSDAEAGVVNFRLREQFDGIQFDGDWGETGYGDGTTYTAAVTAGLPFGGGRGALMGSVAYSSRDQVNFGDRKFSRVALGYYGPGTDGVGPGGEFLPQGSGYIEEGKATVSASRDAFDALLAKYGYAAGTVPYQRNFGFNSDGTLFTTGNRTEGSVANFRGYEDPETFNGRSYTYNYAPPNSLQLPQQRTSVFADARFEFNESVELYAQGIYGHYKVDTQQAPTPVPSLYIPVTNPYVPSDLKFLLDSRPVPEAPIEFSKRVLELGPRVNENNYDTYQATVGLRGTVLEDWQYNGYAQYGRSDQARLARNNVRVSKFEELLNAPDGGAAICGGLNPFGLGSISAECAQYFAVTLENKFTVEQVTAELSFSGAPIQLPAGGLNVVLGVFYKDDSFSQRPDPAAGEYLPDGRPDVAGWYSGLVDMNASQHNVDFYMEALVPLLADKPGVRSLQTVLGYRYSDYSSFGGTSTYKAELQYEPVDPVHVRGSFQRAVRAPSLTELYDPQLETFSYIFPPDPCSVGSDQRTGPNGAAIDDLCLAQGMSPMLLETYYSDEAGVGIVGGNPDLQPEEARTYTAGIVFNSPFSQPALRNLRASLDWWDIDITQSIFFYDAYRFVANCYDPMFNPDLVVSNEYCSWFKRDPESGLIVDSFETYRNIASQNVSGIDLQLDWSMDAGPGELGVTWLVTWYDSYTVKWDPHVKGEQWVKTGVQPTIPEWKWNLDLRNGLGGLTFDAVWNYLGSFRSRNPDAAGFSTPATSYLDLTASYEFDNEHLDGLSLRIGVTNLFSQMPPIVPQPNQANTDVSAFDVLGRRYFASVRYAIGPGSR
jgi:outer membrane receptor protein involved in Fe transport